MKIFNFKNKPAFAELWDKCVYNLLYNIEDYLKDIENMFASKGINKQSKIIDVSAGGGFPSLDLIEQGYEIDCFDASDDEVELFNKKSRKKELDIKCEKRFWEEIPSLNKNEEYDFLFCRGNSFIYAGGGWNENTHIQEENSKKAYLDTLKNFYSLLKDGGYMYIDKFKDTETSHYEKVGEIKIGNEPNKDLIFWTERFPDINIRKASMIIQSKDGEREAVPNITYDLKEDELVKMIKEAGFSSVEEVELPSETHFKAWLCRK